MSEPTEHEPSPELSALLDALAQPARADEVGGVADAVAAMQSAIAPAGPTERASVHPIHKRTRVAVLAAAGIFLVGGAAAAAGFDPIDRPPSIDAPPVSVPPVVLPAQARGPQQTAPTTTTPTTSTTEAPAPPAAPSTTAAPTTTADPTADPTTTAGPTTTGVASEVVCAEGNHGETVSSVAHAVEPGPEHGPAVAAAAQSDCGKDTTDEPAVSDEAVPATADAARGTASEDHGRPDDAGRPADAPGNTAPGRTGSAGRGRSGG